MPELLRQILAALQSMFPASLGQKTKATALGVTLASDEDLLTNLGAVNETAPTTDIAPSGLNGRLQRIAQRLSSLIALIPTALTTLGNFKVSIQEQVIRTYTKATGTTASSGDQTLVAAPSAGNHLVVKDIIIQNESAVDTTVILKNGATAEWRAKLLASSFAAFTLSFAEGEEWRLTTASALVLNLSGANSHGYSIRYRIEAD